MKKIIFKSKNKCWFLFAGDILIFLGAILVYVFFENETYGLFSYYDIYMLIIMPMYAIFHGILSYVVVKKIWLPNIILFVVSWMVYPIIASILFIEPIKISYFFSIQGLWLPCFLFANSLITSLLVCGTVKVFLVLFRKDKKNKSVEPEVDNDMIVFSRTDKDL